MLIYLTNILLVIIWAFVFSIGKKTEFKKFCFIFICFAQMYLISAYRYEIDSDYAQYATGFYKMAVSGFSEMTYEDWEIGFILLNKIIGLFTTKVSVFIAITSLIILVGPAFLVAKYSKHPFISIFIYLNIYLFYLDMNFIRQAIAMSIICFAYKFLIERKFWKYLLIILLAATFHLTVLYMIPVYFICLIPVSTKTHLAYLIGVVLYFVFSDGLIKLVFSKFHTEYINSVYLTSGVYFRYCIVPLILCVGMIALSYFVKEKSRRLNVLIHLTLMMGFWQIIMTKHALFERFTFYTMLFVILAIPEGIDAFKDRLISVFIKKYSKNSDSENPSKAVVRKAKEKSAVITLIVTSAIMVLLFGYNMMGLIIPVNGVHGVLPYKVQDLINLPSIDSFFKG